MMRTSNTNDTYQSNYNAMYFNDYNFVTRLLDERLIWVIGGTLELQYHSGRQYLQRQTYCIEYSRLTHRSMAGFHRKLSATFGARFDKWTIDDTLINASPIFRVGTNYEFRQGSNIRASFGQAFRSPSIAERYLDTNAGGLVIASNPELEVEKGYSTELGFRQGFMVGKGKRALIGYVDVAGFMMDYKNMIEFGVVPPDTFIFGSTPVFSTRNYARARTDGYRGNGDGPMDP
jgi:outer membrane receptor protein involved in Fe transport